MPIVIVSVANESGELVLSALDAGAVDFVQKPTALATDRLLEIGQELADKVKAAAASHVHARVLLEAARAVMPCAVSGLEASFDVIVIGISTGGPQALKLLIPRLPANLPVPVAVVLHMPVGYTQLYAEKLNETSAIHVREAVDQGRLEAGTVYIAPAGRHLTLERTSEEVVDTSRRPPFGHALTVHRWTCCSSPRPTSSGLACSGSS